MNMENPENPIETLEAMAGRLLLEAKRFIKEHGFNEEAERIVMAWKIASEAYTDEVSGSERNRRQIISNFDLADLYELAFGPEEALRQIFIEWDMMPFDGHPDLLEQYHERRAALEAKIAESRK